MKLKDITDIGISKGDYNRALAMTDLIRDSKPLTKGKWNLVSINEKLLKIYRCSICGNGSYMRTNFCPNCRAKMGSKKTDICEM